MQFQKTRLSEALGQTLIISTNDPKFPQWLRDKYSATRAWPMTDIVNSGVELDQFDPETWHYSANFDVVFVKKSSKLYTWLSLI